MSKRTHNTLNDVSLNTRSKKPKLTSELTRKKNPWISATRTFNYMLDDGLIDFLEKGHLSTTIRPRSSSMDNSNETFQSYIMKRGIEFEARVVEYINQNIAPVVTVADFYSLDGVNKTKSLLKQGVPVLHSAPMCHTKTKTFGIADLIVRSDYLKKIAPNTVIDDEDLAHSCAFSPYWHYVIIDIKFSTLALNCMGKNLVNSGSYPAYKSQVWIYNRALGAIQRYTAKQGFILGRRWQYKSRGVSYKNPGCFDRLGVIEFSNYDAKIIKKARKAVKWCRDVHKEGLSWSLSPPTRKELYPNMCRDSYRWNSTKNEIANKLNEVTQVWMCGVKNRERALISGITNWKDPNLTSEILGIRGSRGEIVDKMLQINRRSETTFSPEKMKESLYPWRNSDNEVFVDFETLSDIFTNNSSYITDQSDSNFIFQIGIGYVENKKWNYKYFLCHDISRSEEFRIMKEFMNFLESRNNPNIYYWHAENTFWNQSCNAQSRREDITDADKICVLNWSLTSYLRDLRKLFVKEQVVIKGCFSYALKKIARMMKKFNMINTPMESECSDGRTAMVQAWNCYQKFERPWKCGAMKDVTQYNEYDCRLLCDILTYIRNNH
jgi:hypothetical protein